MRTPLLVFGHLKQIHALQRSRGVAQRPSPRPWGITRQFKRKGRNSGAWLQGRGGGKGPWGLWGLMLATPALKSHLGRCRPETGVCLAVPDSLQPQGLQPARLLCPWGSPGKDTGVGCHALLQGIFLTQGWSLHLLCLLHWQADSFLPCHLGSRVGSRVPLLATSPMKNSIKSTKAWHLTTVLSAGASGLVLGVRREGGQ